MIILPLWFEVESELMVQFQDHSLQQSQWRDLDYVKDNQDHEEWSQKIHRNDLEYNGKNQEQDRYSLGYHH